MWEALGRPARVPGRRGRGGNGRLAAQILDFAARELPEFYGALRYVAVEQSAARRERHAEMLGTHLASGTAVSAAELPGEIPAGCILLQ